MSENTKENAIESATHEQLSRRVDALEIKASYADDALDKLDQVIIRQQLQIDLLIKEITDLRQSQSTENTHTLRNLGGDKPPHY